MGLLLKARKVSLFPVPTHLSHLLSISRLKVLLMQLLPLQQRHCMAALLSTSTRLCLMETLHIQLEAQLNLKYHKELFTCRLNILFRFYNSLVLNPNLPARLLKVRRTIRFSYFFTHFILDSTPENSMYASSRTTSIGISRIFNRSSSLMIL